MCQTVKVQDSDMYMRERSAHQEGARSQASGVRGLGHPTLVSSHARDQVLFSTISQPGIAVCHEKTPLSTPPMHRHNKTQRRKALTRTNFQNRLSQNWRGTRSVSVSSCLHDSNLCGQLEENAKMQKDMLLAVMKGSTVFVNYLGTLSALGRHSCIAQIHSSCEVRAPNYSSSSTDLTRVMFCSAHEVASSRQHKSVSASDVLRALEQMDMGDLVPQLQTSLEGMWSLPAL